MVAQLIESLKQEKVKYVVAPYEADAQLVHLEKNNYISGIISEDSDLLIFGAQVLITKMSDTGECVVVARQNFAKCTELVLTDLTDAQFRAMAIFSGCDYSDGIPKVGLKVAHRFLRKYTTAERALRGIKYEGFNVPLDFDQVFEQAELTFLHQRVFCLKERRLIMLNESNMDLAQETLEYIGRDMEPKIAEGIALGVLDPFTKQPFSFKTTLPTVATASASFPVTPAPGSNMKITSFFKKASQSPSTPTLGTSEPTRSSLKQPTTPLMTLPNTGNNNTDHHNRSLVAKRASKLFDQPETPNHEKSLASSSTSSFMSKFFAAVKTPEITKTDTQTSQATDQLSISDFSEDDSDFEEADKENIDESQMTPARKSKPNLNRFAYQHKPPSKTPVRPNTTRKQNITPPVSVTPAFAGYDSSDSSDVCEIETPKKVSAQKQQLKRQAAEAEIKLQQEVDESEKSPSQRAPKRARESLTGSFGTPCSPAFMEVPKAVVLPVTQVASRNRVEPALPASVRLEKFRYTGGSVDVDRLRS